MIQARVFFSALFLFAAATAGCASSSGDSTGSSEEDVTGTTYVEAFDMNGIDQGAWADMRDRLSSEFDQVCGDTFCEGDYADIHALGFACSVSSKKGSLHECVWTFAASLTAVNARSGALTSSVPTYQCTFTPKGTVTQLMTALSPAAPARAIDQKLPGTDASLYDGLVDCMQHPIGTTPLTFSHAAKPSYRDALDVVGDANLETWLGMRTALENGFLDRCGDTFCGGDYGNITPLDFVCSARASGYAGECLWYFGGSYAGVTASTGHVNVSAKTWQCKVPVQGDVKAFATAMTAAGADNVLDRTIPGQTSTVYDALLGCLP